MSVHSLQPRCAQPPRSQPRCTTIKKVERGRLLLRWGASRSFWWMGLWMLSLSLFGCSLSMRTHQQDAKLKSKEAPIVEEDDIAKMSEDEAASEIQRLRAQTITRGSHETDKVASPKEQGGLRPRRASPHTGGISHPEARGSHPPPPHNATSSDAVTSPRPAPQPVPHKRPAQPEPISPLHANPKDRAAEAAKMICRAARSICTVSIRICRIAERFKHRSDFQAHCQAATRDCLAAKKSCLP
jgi:hypothetical protein